MSQQTYGEWMRSNPPIPNLTAVEWLEEQLKSIYDKEGKLPLAYTLHLVEQAKQMEKEQLDKAYYKGQESKYIGGPSYCEQYYNETFGNK